MLALNKGQRDLFRFLSVLIDDFLVKFRRSNQGIVLKISIN